MIARDDTVLNLDRAAPGIASRYLEDDWAVAVASAAKGQSFAQATVAQGRKPHPEGQAATN